MSAVQIPDHLKQVIDRQVAEGRAASAAEFLEAAVHRYAEDLEAEEGEIIAGAQEGLAALKRGDYATIASPQDRDMLWERVGNRSRLRLAEIHAGAGEDDARNGQAAPGPR